MYFTSEIRVHEPMIDLHEAKYKNRSCAGTVKGTGGGGPRGGGNGAQRQNGGGSNGSDSGGSGPPSGSNSGGSSGGSSSGGDDGGNGRGDKPENTFVSVFRVASVTCKISSEPG